MLKVESLHCTTKNHKQIFCKEHPGLTLEFFFKMAESIFRQDKGVVQRKKCQIWMAPIFWTWRLEEKREEGGGEEEHRQLQRVMRFTERLKETPTLVLFCKFCKIFKSIIFKEHHRVTAFYVFINQSTFNVLL